MIDLALVVIMIWYAVVGFRQGLAVGALSLSGFVGGALLAIRFAPPLTEQALSGPLRSAVVLVAVLVCAWTGQVLGSILGVRLRNKVDLPVVRAVDQLLGTIAGLVAVALVLWFVGGAVREVAPPALARQVAASRVLSQIDRLVPEHLDQLAADFRRGVSTSAFPRVFEGVRPEPLLPVSAPDVDAMTRAVQTRVRRSVVKVTGEAPNCNRGQEGSGAVIAQQRVITNAHVVAGVRKPMVQLTGERRSYRATVVLFDPRTDVAVLAVPELPAPALPLGTELRRGDDAVVAGYPGNGPYTAVPARVRAHLSATGEDIYGGAGAVRQVYSLYTTVEQGNSGGPLLSVDGALAGLVFAKSLDDGDTGYALTLAEVSDEIAAGIKAEAEVGTAGCTVG